MFSHNFPSLLCMLDQNYPNCPLLCTLGQNIQPVKRSLPAYFNLPYRRERFSSCHEVLYVFKNNTVRFLIKLSLALLQICQVNDSLVEYFARACRARKGNWVTRSVPLTFQTVSPNFPSLLRVLCQIFIRYSTCVSMLATQRC